MFSFLQSYSEQRFHLRELHTDIGTEVIAGLTIFATMGYVLAVVPRMMAEAGLPQGAVLTALVLMIFLSEWHFRRFHCTCHHESSGWKNDGTK